MQITQPARRYLSLSEAFTGRLVYLPEALSKWFLNSECPALSQLPERSHAVPLIRLPRAPV